MTRRRGNARGVTFAGRPARPWGDGLGLRAFELAHPFAPDRDEQRHQHGTDEQADEAHRLDPADQAEERRQERQLDRAADERRADGLVDDEKLDRAPEEQADRGAGAAGREQVERDEAHRQRRAAGHERHEAGRDAERHRRGRAGDPVGGAEDDALADRDQGHARDGRGDRARHDARDPFPLVVQDALADAVDLGRDPVAVAVEHEQGDQHEQEREDEVEGEAARGEQAAVEAAEALAAGGLDELGDRAGAADVQVPALGEPVADARQRGDPGGARGAGAVGLRRPIRPRSAPRRPRRPSRGSAGRRETAGSSARTATAEAVRPIDSDSCTRRCSGHVAKAMIIAASTGARKPWKNQTEAASTTTSSQRATDRDPISGGPLRGSCSERGGGGMSQQRLVLHAPSRPAGAASDGADPARLAPRRPARSVTNCHATRPERPPRVCDHSIASRARGRRRRWRCPRRRNSRGSSRESRPASRRGSRARGRSGPTARPFPRSPRSG